MQIGMNLTRNAYWIKPIPFIDLMKTAGAWVAQGGVTPGPVAVDDRDWPLAIPDGATRIYTMISLEREEELWVRFDGAMEFKFNSGFKLLEKRDGFVRCMASPKGPSVQMTVSQIDPANPPRNITVVPARLNDLWEASEIFNPTFTDNPLVRNADTLRFMDWMATNNSTVTTEGPPVDQRSYLEGVPWSVCLKLARKVGAREWGNIPDRATTALAQAMGKEAGADGIMEDSNEVWNSQFQAGKLAYEERTPEGLAYSVGYRMGKRALELAEVGRKLACGWQPGPNPRGWEKWLLGLKAAGATKDHVSALIGTGYIAGNLNCIDRLTPYMERDDIAGAHAALLADAEAKRPWFDNLVAAANAVGVPAYVYEGGPHINKINTPALIAFSTWVHEHPGIKPAYRMLLDQAEQAGVLLFVAFNLSGPPSKDGYFGADGTPWGEVLLERMVVEEPLTLESLDRRVRALEGRG